MTFNSIQDKIIQEFETSISELRNRLSYFRHMAFLGSILPGFSSEEKTSIRLLPGTKSKIWLDATYQDNRVYYHADSDNSIINGILQLYLRLFSGRTPEEIVNADMYVFNEIALHQHLTYERQQDVSSILQRMRYFAVGFKNREM